MMMMHKITTESEYQYYKKFLLNSIFSIVEENEQVYEEVYENRVLWQHWTKEEAFRYMVGQWLQDLYL